MSRSLGFLAFGAVSIVAVMLVASASTAAPGPTTGVATRTASASEARAVVRFFFEALETRRYAKACSLLGPQLRAESHGMTCRRFLAFGAVGPLVWKITGVRRTSLGTGVVVRRGLGELGRVRMLTWLAIVAPNRRGVLKIVATQLVR